jgi:hypothetical protein
MKGYDINLACRSDPLRRPPHLLSALLDFHDPLCIEQPCRRRALGQVADGVEDRSAPFL